MAPKFVAYYRVSTSRQGISGLGLEAQRAAVEAFVRGVNGEIVRELEEVESGSVKARPRLEEALLCARSHKATLVIAKLDRLARNVHFISQLMESGVEFVAADLPYANRLTVHIIAAVAEYERELIGKRTRAALQKAKERGVKLGNPKAAQQAGMASRRAAEKADDFARSVAPYVEEIVSQGITTYSGIAKALNARGIRTSQGRTWYATSVSNLIKRAESLKGPAKVDHV